MNKIKKWIISDDMVSSRLLRIITILIRVSGVLLLTGYMMLYILDKLIM